MRIEDAKLLDNRVTLLTDETVDQSLHLNRDGTPSSFVITAFPENRGWFFPEPRADRNHRIRMVMPKWVRNYDWPEYFKTRLILTTMSVVNVHISGVDADNLVMEFQQDRRNSLKLVLWAQLVTRQMLEQYGPAQYESVDLKA